MLKFIVKLLSALLKGNLVEVARSNEEINNGKTLAHYDFVIKQKTPTNKAGVNV
ncbi:hypothetical protein ACEN4A_04970 [Latilactobacillus sakei]|uniref:hypothetical protein n=1 Tax=Latilactobacillus TaxID=2767885 RepID=UPI0038890D31